ncbi:unnamed protein product, partial [Discosporangium mesarthrocarpum]
VLTPGAGAGALGPGDPMSAAATVAATTAQEEEAAERYDTVRAFLQKHTEFGYIWVASACMPPWLTKERWRGAVPDVGGSNVFDHLHPAAILACDAILAAPPEREGLGWLSGAGERYTDLELYSMSPWTTLEALIAQLAGASVYYAFRHGTKQIFIGPRSSPESSTSPSYLGSHNHQQQQQHGGHSPSPGGPVANGHLSPDRGAPWGAPRSRTSSSSSAKAAVVSAVTAVADQLGGMRKARKPS